MQKAYASCGCYKNGTLPSDEAVLSIRKAYAYMFRQDIKNALTSLSGSTAAHGRLKASHSCSIGKVKSNF